MSKYFLAVQALSVVVGCMTWTAVHGDNLARDSKAEKVTTFEELVQYVESESVKPYRPVDPLPKNLAELDYETFRQIHFDHKSAWWRETKSPFVLEAFHRGFVQKDRVDLFTIENGKTERLPFSRSQFRYEGPASNLAVPDSVGHAGLRVVGRLPWQNDAQEMLTFIGASYFRGRSANTVYGSSARGLAIDIAMQKPEEFPGFRRLWVCQSEEGDRELRVLAHMDSPSVCGAYEFRFQPGELESTVQVKAILEFRKAVEKVAIAPLTSMWMWGDGLPKPALDSRPACHDSGGLLLRSAEEGWVWRPFSRQSYPSLSHRRVKQLEGFGVMQRNCSLYHYNDHNALYHRRPSVWVTPATPWTNGQVELLELPGAHEGVDNIAAYWRPDELPRVGEHVKLDYKVSFFAGDHGDQNSVARATNFELERDYEGDEITMAIRFSGEALRRLDQTSDSSLKVASRNGVMIEETMKRTVSGDWIVTILMAPKTDSPIDLSVQIEADGSPVTETFSYLCPPQQPQFKYPQVYTRLE